MHSVWHALAIAFVPIYGYFRFHAHMRIVRELALASGIATSLSPGWAVLVWIVTSSVSSASFRLLLRGIETPLWLDLFVVVVDAALVVWAQSTLNSVWRRLPLGASDFRVHPVEWVMMVLGGLLVLLALAGDLLA